MRLSRHLAVVAVVAVTSTLVVASSDPAAAAPRKVNGGTVNTEHGVRVWRGSHPVSKVWVGHAGCGAHTVRRPFTVVRGCRTGSVRWCCGTIVRVGIITEAWLVFKPRNP
jgi:hypothetical protein